MRVIVFALFVACAVAQISSREKQQLLARHNQAKRQARGTDQYRYEWDDAIASKAQAMADTCPGKHSTKGTNLRLANTGENLAWGWPSRTLVSAMNGWVAHEKPYYSLSTNTCDPGKECSHYKQVVWANSNKLGCGKKFCNGGFTIKGKKKPAGDVWVCQYGPQGNVNGVKPYTPISNGNPTCSGCYGSCNNGLCTEVTTCQADLYKVTGSQKRPAANGFYTPKFAQIDGKTTKYYHGIINNLKIYPSGGNYWNLDGDLNQNGYLGYASGGTGTEPPVSGWQIFPGQGGFQKDPNMRVAKCVGPFSANIETYEDGQDEVDPAEADPVGFEGEIIDAELLEAFPEAVMGPEDEADEGTPKMSGAEVVSPALVGLLCLSLAGLVLPL